MKTTKINWAAKRDLEPVVVLADFKLRYVLALQFDSPNLPFSGKAGYQLVYMPTGHVQAEGVDVVAAVAQTFREQRILDRVKAKPSLVTDDPAEGNLAAFLQDVDVEGQAAN